MKNQNTKYLSKGSDYTKHASKRMQQRGISEAQLKLIEAFGVFKYQKGGAYFAYVSSKDLNEIRHALDKLTNVRAVYSDTNELITVMHETRKTRTTKH